MLASQQFESSQVVPADSAADIPAVCNHPPPVTLPTAPLTQDARIGKDVAIPDGIFLTASQQFELEHADTVQANPSKPTRLGAPVMSVTSIVVEQAGESGVPPKTHQQTSWSCQVWGEWAKEWNKLPRMETYEKNGTSCLGQ